MSRSYAFTITFAVVLSLASCKISGSSGGQHYAGGGVVFEVPLQSSTATNGPEGIDYKSANLAASTDGKTLTVNGKSYGTLTSGDVVSFMQVGVVKVNDVPRKPALPLHARKPERPASKEQCLSHGGKWNYFQMGQFYFCEVKTTDGGASCLDNSECQGDCEPIDNMALHGSYARGQCANWLPVPGGCPSHVDHGKVVREPCI